MLYPAVVLVPDDYVDLLNAAIAVALIGCSKREYCPHKRPQSTGQSLSVQSVQPGGTAVWDMVLVEQRQQRLRPSLPEKRLEIGKVIYACTQVYLQAQNPVPSLKVSVWD